MHKFTCLVFLLVISQLSAEILNEYEKTNNKPEYLGNWNVELKDGQSPESLESLGFEVLNKVGNLPNVYLVRHKETHARYERERVPIHSPARDITTSLLSSGVSWAEQEKREYRVSKVTINDPLYASQWHLRNTGQNGGVPGTDVNIVSAWDAGYTGTGVQIAIVDDGYQFTHPDLSQNYVATSSRNFRDDQPANDLTPSVTTEDFHGTSVAGVAMAARNSVCGVGAAFDASGASIRLIGPVGASSSTEATAVTYSMQTNDIFSNSWGPPDDGIHVWPQSNVVTAAIQNAVLTGRGGLGNVYTWSAGNGGLEDDNSNYDGFANSRFVIAVAAVGDDGLQSYYSEPGANVVVAAPSNSDNPLGGIRTTDLLGDDGYSPDDCTDDFGGTSSACPLVSGIIALMLQARPDLTWRDVPVILAATARHPSLSLSDPDWVVNGRGYLVNHKYGFGIVDAAAAINASLTHTMLSALLNSTASASVNQNIPDNNSNGPTATLSVTDSFYVERVVVTVTINHARAGDLQIVLTSPSGTRSVLATPHASTPAIAFSGNTGYPLGVSVAGPRVPDAGVQGTLLRTSPTSACTISNCNSLRGAIAAVDISGTCFFDSRIVRAQQCGAVAVVFYDSASSSTDDQVYPIPSSGVDVGVNIPAGYMSGRAYAIATSYFGQTVRLGRIFTSDNSYQNGWAFQSVRHLGEGSQGQWTVNVVDQRQNIAGTFVSCAINVYGSTNSAAFPAPSNVSTPLPVAPTAGPSSSSVLSVSFALLALVCFCFPF